MVIALFLGYHMMFRLDRFDWNYEKVGIWVVFFGTTLLWPLMFKKPQLLLTPRKLFQACDDTGIAERMREESRLRSNPPPCGTLISYHQREGEMFGEFTFQTADVIKEITGKLLKNPHLAQDHEGAILNWLRRNDDSLKAPTPVPKTWYRFEFIAASLVRKGCGEVRCIKCNAQIPKEIMMLYQIAIKHRQHIKVMLHSIHI